MRLPLLIGIPILQMERMAIKSPYARFLCAVAFVTGVVYLIKRRGKRS